MSLGHIECHIIHEPTVSHFTLLITIHSITILFYVSHQHCTHNAVYGHTRVPNNMAYRVEEDEQCRHGDNDQWPPLVQDAGMDGGM